MAVPALDSLSPTQRRLLAFGVPAVALVVLGSKLGARKEAEEEPEGPPTMTAPPAPSTDVVGIGQLVDFESGVTQHLRAQQDAVNRLIEEQRLAAERSGQEAEGARLRAEAEAQRLAFEIERTRARLAQEVREAIAATPPPAPAPTRRHCSSPPPPPPATPDEVRMTDWIVTSTGCGALYLYENGAVKAEGDAVYRGSVPGLPNSLAHVSVNRPFTRIEWLAQDAGYKVISGKHSTAVFHFG